MIKRIMVALAIFAATFAVSQAPAHAVSCFAYADAPYYLGSSSGSMAGRGRSSCSANVASTDVLVYLRRDGVTVDSSTLYCTNTNECTTFATSPNLSGNQVWCTQAKAYMNGTLVSTSSWQCETTGY